MLVNASKKSQNLTKIKYFGTKDSKWIVKCRKKSHKKIVVNFVIIIHVIFYYNSHLFTCKYEMIVK